MFTLNKIQIIDAPIDVVFPFFESPENLELITPSNLGFKIKTPRPLIMKEGAEFKYTIRLGILRFPWITLISKYNPPYMFQDIQKFGPYKKWEHTHEFIDMGDKTQIIDTVEYDLFPKFLNKAIHKLFIERKVEKIFENRKDILQNIFLERMNSHVEA